MDESERDNTYYYLGALVVTEPQAAALSQQLDDLVERYAELFPALKGIELHGSTMMRAAEEPWRSIPLRVRFRIYEEVMSCIAASGARLFIEGVNIPRQAARGYPTLTPPRELAFSHLFEQLDKCCAFGEQIRVVADEHHTSEVSRSNFTKYQNAGTYGYKSSKLPNIHPDIRFVASHTSRVLQAADMATYLWNRVETVTESTARANAQKMRMWALVSPAQAWPRGRRRTWP